MNKSFLYVFSQPARLKISAVIACCALLASCGLYRYKYDPRAGNIVAVKGNGISSIGIKDTSGDYLVLFSPLEARSSRIFNLRTFSPECFSCSDPGFHFERGKTYLVEVLPQGDRRLLPVKLKVQDNGKIVQLK